MNRSISRAVALPAATMMLVVMMGSGCSAKHKDRIALLEQRNADLGAQLGRVRGDLAGTQRNRADLDERLRRAVSEVNGLRGALAAAETPVQTPTESPADGWTAVPGGAMIAVPGNVLFAPGKVTIRPEAGRTLDGIASTIQGEYAEREILVFGHTDATPIKHSGWADNWELSVERALAVTRYLQNAGTAPHRLAACGCGEHRPMAENESAAGRSRNRRVEIYALDRTARDLGR